MGSENSRYGVARPLLRLALCSFSFFPPFAAQPRWGGECQGWGAAPPAAQRRALALTPESPRAVYCEAFEGGRKAAEGQPQAEQPRSPLRTDVPWGGSPGRLFEPPHAQALAGRGR